MPRLCSKCHIAVIAGALGRCQHRSSRRCRSSSSRHPPQSSPAAGGGRALSRGRHRAPRRPSGDKVFVPMTPSGDKVVALMMPSSSLRPLTFRVSTGGGAPASRLVLPRSQMPPARRRMMPPIQQRLTRVSICPSLVVDCLDPADIAHLDPVSVRLPVRAQSAPNSDTPPPNSRTVPIVIACRVYAAPSHPGGISPCDSCVGSAKSTKSLIGKRDGTRPRI